MDAGLRDGHRLLLHDLVDGHAVRVRHLIKLIDAADAAVSKDHRARLKPPVARLVVLCNGRGEADAGRASSRGGHGEGGDAKDEAEQLRLGGRWVAEHKNIEVAAEVGAVWKVLWPRERRSVSHE